MRKYFFAFLLFFIFSSQVNAGWVLGGYYSCGNYIDAIKNNYEILINKNTAWVKGYISGMNIAKNNNNGKVGNESIDDNSIKLAIENFCYDNPLKDTQDAAQKIYYDFD